MDNNVLLVEKDAQQASNLIRDTLITGLEKLSGFRGESSLKSWLTGILINKSRNARRKNRTIFGYKK